MRKSRTRGSAGSTSSTGGGGPPARRRGWGGWGAGGGLGAPRGRAAVGGPPGAPGPPPSPGPRKAWGGVAGERLAPQGQGVEERVGVRAVLPEPVPAAEVVGAALLAGERGQMRVVLDALSPVVAARVARDLGAAVEEPDDVFGGDEGK